jgi:hypothetical protein
MSILSRLFNRNGTIKEPATTKSGRGRWTRCLGSGKTMLHMKKHDGVAASQRWYGTCGTCGKSNLLGTKRGVAWPHMPLTT